MSDLERSPGSLVPIRGGFMPLLDCAPLVAASALGFAAAEGLHLMLARETSWATLRDRIAVGHLDAAHMLAPMPIAANLGLTPLPAPLLAPMALGFGGNTVTVSAAISAQLTALGAPADLEAGAAARAIAALVGARAREGLPRLVIGIVHPHSAHHYQLAYWLAAAGLDPSQDVDLVVVPPSLMPAALAGGQVDGFCAGEPWGSVASHAGAGAILTTSARIWRSSPEKVLGVRRAWADEDPERLARLVRAVYRAACWCDEPANRGELAALLSRPEHLDQDAQLLAASLAGRIGAADAGAVAGQGFLTFAARAATFPWISHALWFYAQMVRWGQIEASAAGEAAARSAYRPDLYRAALAPLGVAVPTASAKVEGLLTVETAVASVTGRLTLGPDVFFDGGVFDPEHWRAATAGPSSPQR